MFPSTEGMDSRLRVCSVKALNLEDLLAHSYSAEDALLYFRFVKRFCASRT